MNAIFDTLLNEFAQAQGVQTAPSTKGIEFECEGHRVYIVQHPLHNDHLLAEVTVTAFEEMPPASLLALMMQINEAARFEHDWFIVMDAEWQLNITTARPLSGLAVAQLEALMLEGVTRAQALQRMLEGGTSDTNNYGNETPDLNPLHMVRA